MKIMGKKATTAKTPAPAKRTAKPSAAKPPAAEKKTAVRAKPANGSAAPKGVSKAPGFTNDDIAMRAYFIAEKRRHHGQPGDVHHDWLEAERQLRAESAPPKKARPAKSAAK